MGLVSATNIKYMTGFQKEGRTGARRPPRREPHRV
jgi:hypothetical protein